MHPQQRSVNHILAFEKLQTSETTVAVALHHTNSQHGDIAHVYVLQPLYQFSVILCLYSNLLE